jgi:predicted lipoprotein with Yx(FWY)xxD motif
MRGRVTRLGVGLLAAGAVAGVCAPSALAAPGGGGTPAAGHEVHHSQGIEIATRHVSLGRVLTNQKGRVLYISAADTPNVSHCSAGCLSVWPRVTSTAKPRAEDGVRAGQLGRTAKGQVTYYGHPLYYFASDTKPREAGGQGVGSFYVISPSGKVITRS